jgi:hypothetical protein
MAPEVKTAKNSKLPKLSENCFEPVGKGGWPPISIWINLSFNFYLNINGICIESHHGSKSTLGELEHWIAIVGSAANFWDLIGIPGEQVGANLVQ